MNGTRAHLHANSVEVLPPAPPPVPYVVSFRVGGE
jgi:hypothetical protein